MHRRTFIQASIGAGLIGASGAIAAPAIAQAAKRTLKFVPQANLANFDPIWGTQYVVRNAAALVWDTLYGVDEKLVPQRQMVESETVSDDGLTWTFKLRSASDSTTASRCSQRMRWQVSPAGRPAIRWA